MSSVKNSPYNLSQLETIASGNNEFVVKMIKMFLEMTPELVDRIDMGVKSGDWSDVRAAAHKMKPSLEIMGIDTLHNQIRSIEHNAKTETGLEQMPALVQSLKDVLSIVYKNLEANELRDE